ncbi:MAG TPA: phosphate signaling complex protein PhoU [Polyangia bacterium]
MRHYEETLQRDIERIRAKVRQMAGLAENSLRSCLRALIEKNRSLAYSVIVRDQRIDELEKEIDRLCLEFIVRQQPVAGTLRFAYAAIKINSELERVGDYAESMARQILMLSSMDFDFPRERFTEIAQSATPMLHVAIEAFVTQDVALAKKAMDVEETVDRLRHVLNAELVQLQHQGKLPLNALSPLMTIVNRFERVADQAKSICQEVMYMCTGEYHKHTGSDVFRLLFVDEHNSCRSQMAEAIGNSLGQSKFIFASAGLDRKPIDPRTLEFLREKGLDSSRQSSKAIDQIPHLDHYQIIVALAKEAERVFPPPPTKAVCLDWSLRDPSKVEGTSEEIRLAYQQAFDYLHAHIQDLVEAVLGDAID